MRIVWHYSADFEPRTFTIRYRLEGLAVAYDDVVDVNLQVWGERVEDRARGRCADDGAPGRADDRDVPGFGHPAWVRGGRSRHAGQAHLEAFDIPAEQYVELRVVFPRALASTARAPRRGDAPPSILAEEQEDADAYESDRERIDEALDHLPLTILILLLLAAVPPPASSGVYFVYGRERDTGYDREYEQEPPSELAPALVPTLLRQGGRPARTSSRPRSSTSFGAGATRRSRRRPRARCSPACAPRTWRTSRCRTGPSR